VALPDVLARVQARVRFALHPARGTLGPRPRLIATFAGSVPSRGAGQVAAVNHRDSASAAAIGVRLEELRAGNVRRGVGVRAGARGEGDAEDRRDKAGETGGGERSQRCWTINTVVIVTDHRPSGGRSPW
jgi:hypothetical protein